MTWEDFFELQYQPNYSIHPERRKSWRLVSKHEQFGNWPIYKERHHAVIAAKAMFRKIEKDIEKSLLG